MTTSGQGGHEERFRAIPFLDPRGQHKRQPMRRDRGALNRSLVNLEMAGFSSKGAALNKLGKAVRAHLQLEQPK